MARHRVIKPGDHDAARRWMDRHGMASTSVEAAIEALSSADWRRLKAFVRQQRYRADTKALHAFNDATLKAECERRGWVMVASASRPEATPETPRKRPTHCDGANAKDCTRKPRYTLRGHAGTIAYVCSIHRNVLVKTGWKDV